MLALPAGSEFVLEFTCLDTLQSRFLFRVSLLKLLKAGFHLHSSSPEQCNAIEGQIGDERLDKIHAPGFPPYSFGLRERPNAGAQCNS